MATISPLHTVLQHISLPHRRWLQRTGKILLNLLTLFTLLAAGGLSYEALMAPGDGERYPPPGTLVDVGGHRLHLYCIGQGSPTVLFEAGHGGSSLDWQLVQPQIAKTTRACAYDRAGYGWSDMGPLPRTPQQIVTELHTLLTNAGIDGPYVLVGHSMGGRAVRLFASCYPHEVVGMVLVDARHESLDQVLSEEQRRADQRHVTRSNMLAHVLGRLGILRLTGAHLMALAVPGFEHLPATTRTTLAMFLGKPKQSEAFSSEFSAETAADALLATASLGDRPLRVLVAQAAVDHDPRWLPAQQQHATLSSRSGLTVVPGRHYLQLDQPAQVAATITEVVQLSDDQQTD